MLASRGYGVLDASSADEAERLCDNHPTGPDLLLVDVVMPGRSGLVLADALSARYPRMKVVYMSGYTNEAIVDRGALDPSVAFIGKPFTLRALASKVRDALDRR